MSDQDVVVLVGSLRRESWNHRVAHSLAALAPAGMSLDIRRTDLPSYDADLDTATPPEEVAALRARVVAADGLLVVSPEYNYGIPGVLKNTLDWLSRPAYRSPLRDKPVTSLGASMGAVGAGRALTQVNDALTAVAAAVLPWPASTIGAVDQALDADGRLRADIADRARRQLGAFAHWITAVGYYRALSA